MRGEHALRVALVWSGTVMQERSLLYPSETTAVTIGESRRNTFVVSGREVPDSFVIFRRSDFGYVLRLLPGMGGKLMVRGEPESVDPLAAACRHVTPGDWGILSYQGVSLFFQFVRPDRRPPTRIWLSRAGVTSVAAMLASLLLHLALMLLAFALHEERIEAAGTVWREQIVRVQAEPESAAGATGFRPGDAPAKDGSDPGGAGGMKPGESGQSTPSKVMGRGDKDAPFFGYGIDRDWGGSGELPIRHRTQRTEHTGLGERFRMLKSRGDGRGRAESCPAVLPPDSFREPDSCV